MNNYNIEHIEKLRIHELRDFARKLGVSSPTTMKKEELIGKISNIINSSNLNDGDNTVQIKSKELDFFALLTAKNDNIIENLLLNSRKKFKRLSDITGSDVPVDIANAEAMIKNNQKLYGTDAPYSMYDDIKFSFSIAQNECDYYDDDSIQVIGYLDIHPSGYGILRNNGFIPSSKDAYLTANLIKKHNLKVGNHISGQAKNIMASKPKVVYEINSIENNYRPADCKDKCYDEMEFKGFGDEFYIDDFELSMRPGERHYVANMSLDDAYALGCHIAIENAPRVKLLNIKALPEENYESNEKVSVINIPFNKTDVEVLNTVELVLERMKREFELNTSNLLIVYRFSELIRILNSACEGNLTFDKFNAKALNKIYNILYIAKHFDIKSHCTVLCVDKNGATRDVKDLMELELFPLFNKIHDKINRIR